MLNVPRGTPAIQQYCKMAILLDIKMICFEHNGTRNSLRALDVSESQRRRRPLGSVDVNSRY